METACAMLRDGRGGREVMQMLREHYASDDGVLNANALSVCVSRVRAAILAESCTPADVAVAMAPYAATEPGVAAFLALPLSGMVRVQREHQFDPSWSDDAEAALQQLALIPDALRCLKLSQSELVRLKRAREGVLIRKQETLVHVRDAGRWLAYAIELAQQSTTAMSFPRLALPLLLLSGRRTTELLNGKSTFEPTTSGASTCCVFTGAVKKRGAATSYVIPLLCEHATFAHALGVLRAKQEYEQLEPAACNNRYQKMLNKSTAEVLPIATNVHRLRAIYAALAYHLYASDVTFNRAAMRMLGHEKLDVSLSYNTVVLHDAPLPGSYGLLPP